MVSLSLSLSLYRSVNLSINLSIDQSNIVAANQHKLDIFMNVTDAAYLNWLCFKAVYFVC